MLGLVWLGGWVGLVGGDGLVGWFDLVGGWWLVVGGDGLIWLVVGRAVGDGWWGIVGLVVGGDGGLVVKKVRGWF